MESLRAEIETIVTKMREPGDRLVEEASSLFLSRVGEAASVEAETVSAAAETVRSLLLNRILSPSFFNDATPGLTGDEERGYVSLWFRSIAAPLVLPEAPQIRELPVRAWAYTALFGAVAGAFFLTPLSRLLLENRDVGLMLGGPLGAFAMIRLVAFLIRRPGVARMAKWMLGGSVLLEIGSAAGLHINPVGMMLSRIKHRHGGGGFLGMLKRIGLYSAGIFLLQFVVPTVRVQWDIWKKQIETTLKNWIDHHTVILVLLAFLARTKPWKMVSGKESIPPELMAAMQKLASVPETARLSAAEELIGTFKTVGFRLSDTQEVDGRNIRFTPAMAEAYRQVGIVRPGDPVRILEPPVYFQGQVVKKGRLTRERRQS